MSKVYVGLTLPFLQCTQDSRYHVYSACSTHAIMSTVHAVLTLSCLQCMQYSHYHWPSFQWLATAEIQWFRLKQLHQHCHRICCPIPETSNDFDHKEIFVWPTHLMLMMLKMMKQVLPPVVAKMVTNINQRNLILFLLQENSSVVLTGL